MVKNTFSEPQPDIASFTLEEILKTLEEILKTLEQILKTLEQIFNTPEVAKDISMI